MRGSGAALLKLTKELTASWERTRHAWRDEKGREFGERYIDDLPDRVGAAVRVMEEIERLLTKVRRDCE